MSTMEKAGTVLRRSGTKLRTSLGGSPHGDLEMAIAQLRDAKATHRAFSQSEAAAWQDVTKWGLREGDEECGRAIADALCQIGELSSVWAEAQREHSEALRELRRGFEMVLEGERGVDAARGALSAAEAQEQRQRKELKKAARRRATQTELAELTSRLEECERARCLAAMEVQDRAREHGVVKTVRVREGLIRATQSYVDSAQKCETLFAAAHFVARQIPDVSDAREVGEVKYVGSGDAMRAVRTARDRVKNFRTSSGTSRRRSHGGAPPVPPPPASLAASAADPPPPYSESLPPAHGALSSNNTSMDSSFGLNPTASALPAQSSSFTSSSPHHHPGIDPRLNYSMPPPSNSSALDSSFKSPYSHGQTVDLPQEYQPPRNERSYRNVDNEDLEDDDDDFESHLRNLHLEPR